MADVAYTYPGSPGHRFGRQHIVGFPTGATLRLDLKVTKIDVGASIARAVLTIKASEADTDAGAIVQREMVVTDTGAGDRTGRVEVTLSQADTKTIGTATRFWAATVYDSDGKVLGVEGGNFKLERGLADSGSAGTLAITVEVTPAGALTQAGLTRQYTATVRDQYGNALPGRPVSWYTSNPNVATISNSGLLTGKAAGSITVGAVTADGVVGIAAATIGPDDVGQLGIDLADDGNGSVLAAVYDARRNVRDHAGSVVAWDDARCAKSNGRVVAGDRLQTNWNQLSGATKCTVISWVQNYAPVSTSSIFGAMGAYLLSVGDAGLVTVFMKFVTDVNAYGNGTIPGHTMGDIYKIATVYDGAGAANIDRLKVYWSRYNRATDTWSADVQLVLAFGSSGIPVALDAHVGTYMVMGNPNIVGQPGQQPLDELRVWAGVALTFAQVQAELLTVSPAGAHLRYTFDGDFNNSGSLAGFNLTGTVGSVFVSDELKWSHPLVGRTTEKPSYDLTALPTPRVVFDGRDDKMWAFGANLRPIATDDAGVTFVGKAGAVPTMGNRDRHICWQRTVALAAESVLLDTAHIDNAGSSDRRFHAQSYDPGTGLVGGPNRSFGAGNIPTDRRIIHSYRSVSGNVTWIRYGSEARGSQGKSAGAQPVLNAVTVGSNADGTSLHADIAPNAIVLIKNQTDARTTVLNTWASTYHGTLLA